ncbi:MAG: GTPase [Pirellulales bacterium]
MTIATPRGRGAIATLLIAGTDAAALVGRFFLPSGNASLDRFPLGRIAHGRWRDPAGEEVVAVRRDEGTVEIHCHGGEMAANALCADLLAAGLTNVDWRDWIDRHEPDAIAAAAYRLLPQAPTFRTASILLDQAQGALQTALDEIETDRRHGRNTIARDRAKQLLAWAPLGLHLVQPWKVVVAGPPNAGKSSLVNALVGYERAIVWDLPGTTRDVLSAVTAIGGWPIELVDTAGLRISSDPLEAEGVVRARSALAEADLVVLVFDVSLPWFRENERLVAEHPTALLVHAKCDLASAGPRPPGVATRAKCPGGVDELLGAISLRLVPDPPPAGAAVVFTSQQIAELRRLAAIDG